MKHLIIKIKQWYFVRKVNAAHNTILMLDEYMSKAGMKRHERRQYWREFAKDASFRVSCLNGAHESMRVKP